MERRRFEDWYAIREGLGAAMPNFNGTEHLSQEGQIAVEKLKAMLHGSPPDVAQAALSDPERLMRKYRLDHHEVQEVIAAVMEDLGL